MLKLLLLALLVAAAIASRWLAPALGLPGWVPAALTALAIGVALAMVIVALAGRWLRRRAAARRRQDPVLRSLRAYLGQELARLAEDGARGLPWALVIGPPGAGKSALVRRSGLSFREGYSPERFVVAGDQEPTDRATFSVGAAEGAGSMVIVDTSGRGLAAGEVDGERESWGVLLQALADAGPTSPLAAIVVVVGGPELLAGDPAAIAGALRARIDDAQARLGATVPVYVVVSRLDRFAGAEALLRAVGRDRLGIGVEVSGPGADAARKIVLQGIGALVEDLERAAFTTLGAAAGPTERAARLRAADLFAELGRRSAELCAGLFADHGQDGAPVLRGLLWASGGAPTPAWPQDPVLEDLRQRTGDPPLAGPTTATRAAPLLIGELFPAMIPGDRWIATPSRARVRRARLREGSAPAPSAWSRPASWSRSSAPPRATTASSARPSAPPGRSPATPAVTRRSPRPRSPRAVDRPHPPRPRRGGPAAPPPLGPLPGRRARRADRRPLPPGGLGAAPRPPRPPRPPTSSAASSAATGPPAASWPRRSSGGPPRSSASTSPSPATPARASSTTTAPGSPARSPGPGARGSRPPATRASRSGPRWPSASSSATGSASPPRVRPATAPSSSTPG
ncbi:MAG: type VI secretion protein IcmF/TssM N-terminal domain-containing protein [Nannocystaceae bacterium]